MTETWYLLFGGSSPDGRGEGGYVGRTIDKKLAFKHFNRISKDPYSTGYVTVITDTSVHRATLEDFNRATVV